MHLNSVAELSNELDPCLEKRRGQASSGDAHCARRLGLRIAKAIDERDGEPLPWWQVSHGDPEIEHSASIERKIRGLRVERTRATAALLPIAGSNHHAAQPGLQLLALSELTEVSAPFEEDLPGNIFGVIARAQGMTQARQLGKQRRIAFIEVLVGDRCQGQLHTHLVCRSRPECFLSRPTPMCWHNPKL